MDFHLNNNNNTLVNNTKLLRWIIFLYIHYCGPQCIWPHQ